MKQLLNKYKINGSVQLKIYDQNNNLVDVIDKKNQVLINGRKAYRNILGLMDDPNFPASESLDNQEEINIQSNSVDFLSQNGQMPFLQAQLANKQLFNFEKSFRFDDSNMLDNSGNSTGNTIISNESIIDYNNINSCFLNEQMAQSKVTTYSGWNYTHYAFVYSVNLNNSYNSENSDNSYQNIQDNIEKYITGLCIDIKAPQAAHAFFQVAFDFDGIQINSKNDIPPPIIPFSNGCPIHRIFSTYQGNAMLNDKIYTHVFDMYPRYCKIPKKIILIFNKYNYGSDMTNSRSDASSVQIKKIQFLTHRQPKYGPIAIYFSNTQNANIVATKIKKVQVQGNTILYYASLGYEEGNGNTFNAVGLSNSENNVVYKEDELSNTMYYNNKVKLFNTAFTSNTYTKCFYTRQLADAQDCNNCLTLARPNGWNFNKNKKNRIDVIYRMNFTFGH